MYRHRISHIKSKKSGEFSSPLPSRSDVGDIRKPNIYILYFFLFSRFLNTNFAIKTQISNETIVAIETFFIIHINTGTIKKPLVTNPNVKIRVFLDLIIPRLLNSSIFLFLPF